MPRRPPPGRGNATCWPNCEPPSLCNDNNAMNNTRNTTELEFCRHPDTIAPRARPLSHSCTRVCFRGLLNIINLRMCLIYMVVFYTRNKSLLIGPSWSGWRTTSTRTTHSFGAARCPRRRPSRCPRRGWGWGRSWRRLLRTSRCTATSSPLATTCPRRPWRRTRSVAPAPPTTTMPTMTTAGRRW